MRGGVCVGPGLPSTSSPPTLVLPWKMEGTGGGSLLTLTSLPAPPASQVLESRLQRPLPEDLAEALASGVILCQLANQLRPRSVPFIHVPSPAVVSWGPGQEVGVGTGDSCGFSLTFFFFLTHPQPKLSALKSRKNVESFLEACRKMGVPEVWGCVLRSPGLVSALKSAVSWAQLSTLHGRRDCIPGGCLLPRRKHVPQPRACMCPLRAPLPCTLHVGVALALAREGRGWEGSSCCCC